MDASRHTLAERRAIERSADALRHLFLGRVSSVRSSLEWVDRAHKVRQAH